MPALLKRVLGLSGSSPRVVALLTDFGARDQYVAVVKGVLLTRNPRLTLVDISHDVTPQGIGQAAYLLWAAYRYLPPGTVFLVVVDPGVGTDRPILIVRTDRYTFVAPDNGVLDMVMSEESRVECFQGTEGSLRWLSPGPVSRTFHGRDVFAPVAAELSRGVPPEQLGVRVAVPSVVNPFVDGSTGRATAQILHIDRFGTVITNVRVTSATADGRPREVRIGRRTLSRWVDTYADAPADAPVLMVGSSGLLEIAVRNGSAAETLHVAPGMSLTVSRA